MFNKLKQQFANINNPTKKKKQLEEILEKKVFLLVFNKFLKFFQKKTGI